MENTGEISRINKILIRPLRQIYCCQQILLGIKEVVPKYDEYQEIEEIIAKEIAKSSKRQDAINRKVHFAIYKMIYDMLQVTLAEYLIIRIIAVTKSVKGSTTLQYLINSMSKNNPAKELHTLRSRLRYLLASDVYKGVLLWRNQRIGHLQPNTSAPFSIKYKDILELINELLDIYDQLCTKCKIELLPLKEPKGGQYLYDTLFWNTRELFSHKGKTEMF